jgi:hypothetical protein
MKQKLATVDVLDLQVIYKEVRSIQPAEPYLFKVVAVTEGR